MDSKIRNSKSLVEMFFNAASLYADYPAQSYRNKKGEWEFITYREFAGQVKKFASALAKIGIKKGTKVALFSDNRQEWFVCDLAILANGAIDVPRAKNAPHKELSFIIGHSGAEYAIIEDESLLSAVEDFIDPKKIIVIEESEEYTTFKKLLESGDEYFSPPEISFDDIATIIYTSGTTGNPKGVVLTHGNFMHNVRAITPLLGSDVIKHGEERALSILPSWHSFERTFEYCCVSAGVETCYTNVKYFAQDLKNRKPTMMSAVPRIWESVYGKIMDKIKKTSPLKKFIFYSALVIRERFLYAQRVITGKDTIINPCSWYKRVLKVIWNFIIFILLFIPGTLMKGIFQPVRDAVGGRLRGAFTGGGSLPKYIDNFFNAVGITLLNAYGMTECSPGISSRRFERNYLYTVGVPFDETQIKLCDEDGKEVEKGMKGIVMVKGPQVMKEYYRNETATKKILSPDGWLNTGDVGVITHQGDLIIVGRSKDTIVLLGGENVEPTPIEQKLEESEFISHAVVFGDDKKDLGALIVLEEEKVKKLFDDWSEEFHSLEDVMNSSRFVEFIKDQIKKLVNDSKDFHPFEKIKRFTIVPTKFKVGEELTHTLKKKRKYIQEKYDEYIEKMFGSNKK